METDFWKNIINFWVIIPDPGMLERNNEIASTIAEQFKPGKEYKPISIELAQFNHGGDDIGWVD